jgi:hypothetical protein
MMILFSPKYNNHHHTSCDQDISIQNESAWPVCHHHLDGADANETEHVVDKVRMVGEAAQNKLFKMHSSADTIVSHNSERDT